MSTSGFQLCNILIHVSTTHILIMIIIIIISKKKKYENKDQKTSPTWREVAGHRTEDESRLSEHTYHEDSIGDVVGIDL